MDVNVTKSMIAPLVGVVCLGVGAIAHTEIPADLQNNIVTAIVLVGSIVSGVYGIFKDHNATTLPQPQQPKQGITNPQPVQIALPPAVDPQPTEQPQTEVKTQ